MLDATPFPELLARLRHGDPDAVRAFVAHYEPFIRRSIRRRLAYLNLQAAADSGDICQSVLASFFIRAAAGEYELDSAGDLEKLLLTMARNKLIALARHETVQRETRQRVKLLMSGTSLSGASADDPSAQAVERDLLDEVRRRFSAEERDLFQRRQEGQAWSAIAEELGGSAAMLRKRLSRALQRIAVELGLEDDDE